MHNFSSVFSEVVTSDLSVQQFWNGINVWIRSPHVENRRLCGVRNILCGHVWEPNDASQLIDHLIDIAKQESLCFVDFEDTIRILENNGIKFKSSTPVDRPDKDNRIVLKIRELIPKNSNIFQSCREAVVLDGRNMQATFIHLGPATSNLSPRTSYSCSYRPNLCMEGGVLEFGLCIDDEKLEEGLNNWLISKLFPRLVKWIVLEYTPSSTVPVSSLSLVDLNKYNDKYQELKQKYGPQMVQMWPEQTDPLKFVYEDLAIASYLLCLWDSGSGGRKNSFVDLGCGNGLLVHILSSEGHPGLGLDVRSRKLWSMYPPTTRLKIETVIPSLDTTYPDYDWIIGNHSDELTPWIPVMAALSSTKSSFFLLPCCAHDFWGKYQRLNPTNSQYVEYINFVRTVGETCGFNIEIDKLRIPSTKRTCLIGRSRFKNMDKTLLWEYVTSRKHNDQDNFNPRSSIEPVRNCTKLTSDVTEKILKLITKELLYDFKEAEKWWTGHDLPLSKAAALVPSDLRVQLKNEYGGLQTLLRNHHSIFVVQGGVVKFRKPKPSSATQVARWKNKPCWFFLNHPQGCPLEEELCSYEHTTQVV